MSTRQGCRREIATVFAEEILKLVGSKRTDRLVLVGCEHIELLIELVRYGFANVTCCTALTGPDAGEMSGDIIIAPAFDREPRSAAVLSRLEHSLRPGGVLLLGTGSTRLTTQTRQIEKLLVQHGFSFVRRHIEPAGLQVLCCRMVAASQAQAA